MLSLAMIFALRLLWFQDCGVDINGINELQQIVISINLMLDYFGSREKMENRGF